MNGFETIYVDLFTQEEIANILDKYKQRTLVKFDIKKFFESNSESKNFTLINIAKNVKGFVLDIIDTFNEANMDNKGVYEISQMSISLYEGEDDLDLINKYLNIFKKINPPTTNRTVMRLLESLEQEEKDKFNNDFELPYLNYLDKTNIKKSDFIDLNNLRSIPNSKGIYFIYNSYEELMYIGKSIHIHDRITQHLNKYSEDYDWKHNFKKMKYIELNNSSDKELDDYETYFINKCKPPLNISKTYTYQTQRFSIKYNKEVTNFQNLEHYLKFLEAKKYINKKFDIPRIIQNEEKRLKDLKDLLEV